MSSVQSWDECPKCKELYSYGRSFHYRSGEEYCICSHCGYTHNRFLKRDENHELVRKMTKRYDLRKGEVYFAEVKETETKEIVMVESTPVLTEDTEELIYDFIDFRYSEKPFPKRFDKFVKKREDIHTWFTIIHKDDCTVEQLWHYTFELKIEDGYLEVYETEWVEVERGGYGVVTTKDENGGGATYILPKDEVPQITDDVVFATAIVDGKLVVLKERE